MIETQLGNLSQPGHVSANTSCNPPHMSLLTAQRWNGTRGKFSRLKLQRQALRQRTARADGANGTRYTAVCDLAFHFSNGVMLHRYGCGFSLLGLSVAVRFAASELAAPMSGGGRSPSAVIATRLCGEDATLQQSCVTFGTGRQTRSPVVPKDAAGGGGRNRTDVRGFAGPCLNHSATPP